MMDLIQSHIAATDSSFAMKKICSTEQRSQCVLSQREYFQIWGLPEEAFLDFLQSMVYMLMG